MAQDFAGVCLYSLENLGTDEYAEGKRFRIMSKSVPRGVRASTTDAVLPLNTVSVAGAGDEAEALVARQVELNARISARNQAALQYNAQAWDLVRRQERLESRTAQHAAEELCLQRRRQELDAQVSKLARELGEKLKSCPESSGRAEVIAEVISALGLDGPQAAQAAMVAAAAAFGGTGAITTTAGGATVIAAGGLVVSAEGTVTVLDNPAED